MECKTDTDSRQPYHVNQGHVEEHACSDGEDPQRDVVGILSHCRAYQHPDVSHHGRQEVVHNGLLHCHSCFKQHSKVTWNGDRTQEFSATASRDSKQRDQPTFPISPMQGAAKVKTLLRRLKGRLGNRTWQLLPELYLCAAVPWWKHDRKAPIPHADCQKGRSD